MNGYMIGYGDKRTSATAHNSHCSQNSQMSHYPAAPAKAYGGEIVNVNVNVNVNGNGNVNGERQPFAMKRRAGASAAFPRKTAPLLALSIQGCISPCHEIVFTDYPGR